MDLSGKVHRYSKVFFDGNPDPWCLTVLGIAIHSRSYVIILYSIQQVKQIIKNCSYLVAMSILSNDVDIFLNKLCSDLEQKSHKNKVANNYLSTPITRLFLCFCPFVSSTKKILFSALVQNQLDSVSLFLPQELINYLAHRCFTLDAKQCSLRVYIYHTCDVAQIVLGGQCTTSVSLLPLFLSARSTSAFQFGYFHILHHPFGQMVNSP